MVSGELEEESKPTSLAWALKTEEAVQLSSMHELEASLPASAEA